MFMRVIMMLCFMQYMMCEEVTEMMTSESSNKTKDDVYEPVNLTTSFDKPIHLEDLPDDIDQDFDDDEDDDGYYSYVENLWK
uniref:Hypotheticial protein n=1 Tax=Schistosoma japonicum TaxID=6182 RepID=C7TYM7_SCHJA|nr:hypotheticial protein [Schistosoma japonicum]CAX82703.1 hypotheticial protein [Schistosoma japonicum]